MKEFHYVNDLGRLKKLYVYDKDEEGLYPISLWDMETGEYCGSNEISVQKLKTYLLHYNIDANFEEE